MDGSRSCSLSLVASRRRCLFLGSPKAQGAHLQLQDRVVYSIHLPAIDRERGDAHGHERGPGRLAGQAAGPCMHRLVPMGGSRARVFSWPAGRAGARAQSLFIFFFSFLFSVEPQCNATRAYLQVHGSTSKNSTRDVT